MAQKLLTHLDAGAVAKIINHPWPVDPGDSVSKEYADTKVPEAPEDLDPGNHFAYGRRNRVWIRIDFFPDAPDDGRLYGRRSKDWAEIDLAGAGTFINPAPVPVSVGGIAAGSTFPTAQTMQQMWDRLLYPYQPPAFGSFSFGQPGSVEVGYTMPAALTFTWSTSNSANVAPNSVGIVDNSAGQTLMFDAPNDGVQAITLAGGPVQRVTTGSYNFTISARNSQGSSFTRGASISWFWRLHYGVNVNPTLDSAAIGALASSNLASGYAGTYSLPVSGYKYICFAHAVGGQINSVKDQSTGFSVPFAAAVDHAAYSNVDGGGFAYALVSRTNANGVTTQYRVYRTKFVLGGAIVLVVT